MIDETIACLPADLAARLRSTDGALTAVEDGQRGSIVASVASMSDDEASRVIKVACGRWADRVAR